MAEEFELEKHRVNLPRRQPESGAQHVGVYRIVTDGVHDSLLRVSKTGGAVVVCIARGVNGGGGRWRCRRAADFVQYVVYGFHQTGAFLDQTVAAPSLRVKDGAGDGHYLASGFQRLTCGDQRAALQGGFYHQAAARQAGDDAVTAWKVLRQRAHAQRKLGQDQALLGNLVRQLAVAGRVDAVDAGADHGDGMAAGLQCAFVGGGVDTASQTADDGVALCGQPAGKGAGVLFALWRGVAAASWQG